MVITFHISYTKTFADNLFKKLEQSVQLYKFRVI